MNRLLIILIFLSVGLNKQNVYGLENASVLPKGVRKLNIRSVNAGFKSKTNSNFNSVALGKKLEKNITFAMSATKLKGSELKQLEAFLGLNDFALSDSLGQFKADLAGNVSVIAPIFAYGLNSYVTLAIAIPYYKASMNMSLAFEPNDNAKRFLRVLADPNNNQRSKAKEVANKLNLAVESLQDKLSSNSYEALENWQDNGVGDITLAAKIQTYKTDNFKLAISPGVVAPTGRVDDSNILTDIPFGDGQWDLFIQAAVDEKVSKEITLNQYIKYTAQLPGHKTIRAKTPIESLAVENVKAGFDLGDKVEIGTSISWLSRYGLTSGIGYSYNKKFPDSFSEIAEISRIELEKDTNTESHNTEVVLGFSTLPYFKRGAFAVPMDVTLSLSHPVSSQNTPVANKLQLDVNVFF